MAFAIAKDASRQIPRTAYVDFAYADINGTTFTPAIELPAGSVVIGGALTVTTGFIGTTVADPGPPIVLADANATVGDSGSATRYLGSTSLAATGRHALVPTGYTNPGVTNLGITLDSTLTAGAGRLEVEYYVEGRATSTQG